MAALRRCCLPQIPRLIAALGLTLLARSPVFAESDGFLDLTQYAHTAWTDSDELRGRIDSIVQTRDGYLWLGTDHGLVRFDGVRFSASGPGVGPSLTSNHILSLLAGRDGTLWIGTLQGLASWAQGKLVQYPEIAEFPVLALLEDQAGTVWAGGAAGLCTVKGGIIQCSQIDGGSINNANYFHGNRGSDVYSLYEDGDRHLWVGSASGLWQWTPSPPQRYDSQPIRTQQGLAQADHGTGLITSAGLDHGLLQQTVQGGMGRYVVPGEPGPVRATCLLRDRHGALWIGTADGHGLLYIRDGRSVRFSQDNGLSGNVIHALFEDREGTVWVGTTNGLDRFRERAVYTLSSKQGLIPPVGAVLSGRDGSLWIGAVSGLYNWSQGRMTVYRAVARPLLPQPIAFAANEATEIVVPQLPVNEIECLFEDSRGRIWVGTHYGAAWFEKGSFIRVTGLPNESAVAIVADPQEGVWFSYPAAGLFHVIEDRVTETVPWPWAERQPARQLTAVAAEGTTGALWLGFLDGQIAYFKDGQVKSAFGRGDGLGAGTVWNLHVDHEGTLWAATNSGLSRVRDGRGTTLTTKNGLTCNPIDWVTEAEDASLWAHADCGLLRLERSELSAWVSDSRRSIHPTVFDRNDGVSSRNLINRFNSVVTQAADGQLSFVRSDGISFINVLKPRINPVPPPVHIEQISADGKTYSPTPGFRLPPQVRDLSIYYTALSLVAPEKVRFRFKLEGQDSDWREVVNVRDVQYSNLAPSNYHFRVIAANNNGVWNQEGASLDFSIAPAYWQTNWFRVVCAVACVTLLWTLFRIRLRHVTREFERGLDSRVAERTRIARELHDTLLQSFNGLLLRFQTVLDLLPARAADAKQILGGAIDQANKAITEGREAVEGLRSSTQESNDLLLEVRSLGEEFAADKAEAHSAAFRADLKGAPRPLRPIIRDEISRIASEALRNAFHHSRGTQIEAELHYDEREFWLRIRDNGVGIDMKALIDGGQPGHYGLRGMQERAQLIGGKLTVRSALETGTEVELRVPSLRAYAPARSPRTMRALSRWLGRRNRVRL